MNTTAKAIAKAASLAAFGFFALAPGVASAKPAAPVSQSVVVAHMGDAGSAGGGDSHGHNNNKLPETRGSGDGAATRDASPGFGRSAIRE